MRAAITESLDGPQCVRIGDIAAPTHTADAALVRVEYGGLSFPDVLQSRGLYQRHPQLPYVPGWQAAGRIVHRDGSLGERVAALSEIGALAEYVSVPYSRLLPLPGDLSTQRAAAMPLNYISAHLALTLRGRLAAGETVLVHGGGGGLGGAACSIAAAVGAEVIAVASSAAKAAAARGSGAGHVVTPDGFLAQVREITDGRGVDVVLDPVGGDRFTDSLRSLAPGGRLLVLGFVGGEIPTVRVNRLLLSNTSVVGVGAKELWDRDPTLPRVHWDELMLLHNAGMHGPTVDLVVELDQVGTALHMLETRETVGCVVVHIADGTED